MNGGCARNERDRAERRVVEGRVGEVLRIRPEPDVLRESDPRAVRRDQGEDQVGVEGRGDVQRDREIADHLVVQGRVVDRDVRGDHARLIRREEKAGSGLGPSVELNGGRGAPAGRDRGDRRADPVTDRRADRVAVGADRAARREVDLELVAPSVQAERVGIEEAGRPS